MAVFRVERNRGYTVMSNHHLRNRDLTLKAKGLLSQMLSLPDNWDYCLPNVCIPPEEERPIGIYGQRRRVYLKEHHRVLYYNLLTAGVLDGHLADIEEQAQELFLRLVEQYADTEGVTEALKANDQMAWVRKMNGIRHRANEVVMQEIVYG